MCRRRSISTSVPRLPLRPNKGVRHALLISWLWLALLCVACAETMPPKPADYFNDYARVVSPGTARRLNDQLRQFERDSSNQIVVAIFRRMDTASSIEDYTVRIANSWKVGQADRRNGAVLFVFTEPHKMFIQVGYGLEGALPDILCKQIVENEIKPRFKTGDYDGGLTAGVNAMIKATRGEYTGTGKIHSGDDDGQFGGAMIVLAIIVLFVVISVVRSWRRGMVYTSSGRGYSSGWGGGWSSGGWGGGSSSSGGGGDSGGFSGGGGSFGGGGAGGDW